MVYQSILAEAVRQMAPDQLGICPIRVKYPCLLKDGRFYRHCNYTEALRLFFWHKCVCAFYQNMGDYALYSDSRSRKFISDKTVTYLY